MQRIGEQHEGGGLPRAQRTVHLQSRRYLDFGSFDQIGREERRDDHPARVNLLEPREHAEVPEVFNSHGERDPALSVHHANASRVSSEEESLMSEKDLERSEWLGVIGAGLVAAAITANTKPDGSIDFVSVYEDARRSGMRDEDKVRVALMIEAVTGEMPDLSAIPNHRSWLARIVEPRRRNRWGSALVSADPPYFDQGAPHALRGEG